MRCEAIRQARLFGCPDPDAYLEQISPSVFVEQWAYDEVLNEWQS